MPKFPRGNNDLELRLIAAVKARRPLWDPNTPLHKSVKVLVHLWLQVARELDMDELTVRRKWKSLRDYFLRQTKELEKSKVTKGANGKGDVVTLRYCLWPLYEKLTFLTENNVIERRPGLKFTDEDFKIIEEVNGLNSSKNNKAMETIIYHMPTGETPQTPQGDGDSDDCELVSVESVKTIPASSPSVPNTSTLPASMLQYLPPPLQKIVPVLNRRVIHVKKQTQKTLQADTQAQRQDNDQTNSQVKPQEKAQTNPETQQVKEAQKQILNPIVKLIKLTQQQLVQNKLNQKEQVGNQKLEITNPSQPNQQTQKQVGNQKPQLISPIQPNQQTQNQVGNQTFQMVNLSQTNPQIQNQVGNQMFQMVNLSPPNQQIGNPTLTMINPSQFNMYQNPSLTTLLTSNPPPLCKIPPLKRVKLTPIVEEKKNSLTPSPSRLNEEEDADYQFFKSLLPFMKELPMKHRLQVRNSIQQLILKELESVENAKNLRDLSNKVTASFDEEQTPIDIDESSTEENELPPLSAIKDEVIESLVFTYDSNEMKTESSE